MSRAAPAIARLAVSGIPEIHSTQAAAISSVPAAEGGAVFQATAPSEATRRNATMKNLFFMRGPSPINVCDLVNFSQRLSTDPGLRLCENQIDRAARDPDHFVVVQG